MANFRLDRDALRTRISAARGALKSEDQRELKKINRLSAGLDAQLSDEELAESLRDYSEVELHLLSVEEREALPAASREVEA